MSAQAGEMTALAHRRSPPVLGFFREAIDGIHFHPTMEPGPNRVPHGRFASPIGAGDFAMLLGCRHGLVLIFHSSRDQILVWDPVTAVQRRIATPLGFDMRRTPINGAVLRAAGDHFQVVLVGYKQEERNPRVDVCFYSSETGLWKRNKDCDGVGSWVLGRTIELGSLLSLDSQKQSYIHMLGYAEENNVAFFRTIAGIFMVQLHSSQFNKLPENNNAVTLYPLESVYAADSTATPMSAQAGEMTVLESIRSPPVLAFFREAIGGIQFHPTMEPSSRISHGCFSSPISAGDRGTLLGCRHGLVLIFHPSRDQILVWDPVTGVQRRTATPLGFDVHQTPFDGAVLRAAGDHFQVVLVGYKQEKKNPRVDVCFYSSETGVWSNIISTPVPRDAMDHQSMPAVLVRDSLYWLLSGDGDLRVILEVDLHRKSLVVTRVPMDMFAKGQDLMVIDLMVMRAEGGGLGLLSLSDYTVQLWKRSTGCDRAPSWVLGSTVELNKLLPLDSQKEASCI